MILTPENYYSQEANKAYMSVSQFKDFQKCESMAMAKLNGEYEQPTTTALMVGSYVDAYFEGTLDIFYAKHPEIFLKSGKNAGCLKADYAKADEIIQRIESDPVFMEYMSGEKQAILTAEMFGCMWKIKIDSYCPDKIVDLKCMRSLERIMGKSFVEHWGYDYQMAVYAEVERIAKNRNMPLETFLAVATKETVTDIEVIHIPLWRRTECLEQIRKEMPRILAVKGGTVTPERCGVCDYCKSTKVLTEPIDFELVGLSNKEMEGIY